MDSRFRIMFQYILYLWNDKQECSIFVTSQVSLKLPPPLHYIAIGVFTKLIIISFRNYLELFTSLLLLLLLLLLFKMSYFKQYKHMYYKISREKFEPG